MSASRLRQRSTPIVAALMTLTVLIGFGSVTRAVETQPDVAARAVEWLATRQLEGGAFPGFSGDADPATTADAVIAIAATGVDPATITTASGADPVSYLQGLAGDTAGNPGAAGRLLLALHAARGDGLDPTDVEGADLLAIINDGYDADSGTYGRGLFGSAYAILGLRAVGASVEPAAVSALLSAQIEDGSWNFNGDTTPGAGDSNTTAIVVMALVATGASSSQVNAGLDFLAGLQDSNGAIAFDASEDPPIGDANSTALAIQAHIAAGRDPAALAGGNAISALAAFQQPSGAFAWRTEFPDENMLATAQAIPAIVGVPLPAQHLGLPPDPTNELAEAREPATGLGIEGCSYYLDTFHNVCGPFNQYWHANGGLKIFGFPLTESYFDGGIQIQYFERARLELHPGAWPENFDILQGRLGAEQLEDPGN